MNADELVRGARVARLATVDERGRPHVVPVCFAFVERLVYIALDAKPKRVPPDRLRRVRNIRAHPQVQLLVDRWDEDWSRLAYVQLRGCASLVGSGPERARALEELRQKYPQYRVMDLEHAPMLRIDVERIVAWSAAPDRAGASPR